MDKRKKLTEKYLFSVGYDVDETETNLLINFWKSDPEIGTNIDIKSYTNKDGRIRVNREWTNRYGEMGYSVHVDNDHYESVAYAELLYEDEFETFVNLVYDK